MRGTIPAIVAIAVMSPSARAQAPIALEHLGPGEVSFSGAECSLSDDVGLVFRSDWQKRHWIKVGGTPVEFNGKTEMSAAGWYQTFVNGELTLILRLGRVLPEPAGGDGVRFSGEIALARSGQSVVYKVTGSCGA